MINILKLVSAAALLTALPIRSLAEVADKVPSLEINIAVSIISTLFGLALIRIRWWLMPASLAIVSVSHAPILLEILYENVGPAIRLELGTVYIWQPMISLGLGFIACSVYAVSIRKRNRRNQAN